MELVPKVKQLSFKNTHRLIPSKYPPKGIFDDICDLQELDKIMDLESWTNDRLTCNYSKLYNIDKSEWVYNKHNANTIMAAFCHPKPGGGRFNDENRGAWYSALSLETAFEETIYHKKKELLEFTELKDRVISLREYISDFDCFFIDITHLARTNSVYDKNSYNESQKYYQMIKNLEFDALIYNSVRDLQGKCIVCYKPNKVENVRQAAHYNIKFITNDEYIADAL